MTSATLHLSSPPTGKAYSLGRAEYGRLGLGEGAEEKSIPTLISRLPAVSSVACGASVGYAVTKDGEWSCPRSVWLGFRDHDSYQTLLIRLSCPSLNRAEMQRASFVMTLLFS